MVKFTGLFASLATLAAGAFGQELNLDGKGGFSGYYVFTNIYWNTQLSFDGANPGVSNSIGITPDQIFSFQASGDGKHVQIVSHAHGGKFSHWPGTASSRAQNDKTNWMAEFVNSENLGNQDWQLFPVGYGVDGYYLQNKMSKLRIQAEHKGVSEKFEENPSLKGVEGCGWSSCQWHIRYIGQQPNVPKADLNGLGNTDGLFYLENVALKSNLAFDGIPFKHFTGKIWMMPAEAPMCSNQLFKIEATPDGFFHFVSLAHNLYFAAAQQNNWDFQFWDGAGSPYSFYDWELIQNPGSVKGKKVDGGSMWDYKFIINNRLNNLTLKGVREGETSFGHQSNSIMGVPKVADPLNYDDSTRWRIVFVGLEIPDFNKPLPSATCAASEDIIVNPSKESRSYSSSQPGTGSDNGGVLDDGASCGWHPLYDLSLVNDHGAHHTTNQDHWMVMDLGSDKSIGGVAIQSRGQYGNAYRDYQHVNGCCNQQWVKNFTVEYWKDGEDVSNAKFVNSGKQLATPNNFFEDGSYSSGEDKGKKVAHVYFDSIVDARYIKISPKSWNIYPTMKAGAIQCANNFHYTESAPYKAPYKFATDLVGHQEFTFSVKASNDAHVLLTSGSQQFEIVLGGVSNTKSVIRTQPSDKDQEVPEYKGAVCDSAKLKHFKITWTSKNDDSDENVMNVYKSEDGVTPELLMSWKGFEDLIEVDLEKAYISTGFGSSGVWQYSLYNEES